MQRRTFHAGAAAAVLTLAGLPGRARAQRGPDLRATWAEFARRFVQSDGRVVDTGNKGVTHTEGLGTALLAAQACEDRVRFDKIWGFTQQLRRPDGLHAWKWAPGSGVLDRNNATDGDLYIAWALLRAGMQWSDDALLRAAQTLATSIREHLMVNTPRGQVLLPGKDGFITRNPTGQERVVVNPSYWVLPALRELQALDAAPAWTRVYRDALALLGQTRFGAAGLPTDWLLLEDPPIPWRERPARFGYEAIRVPLFLVWERRPDHPTLRACGQHLREPGFPAWTALVGAERAPYAAPPGFEAIARLTRKSLFGQPLTATALDADYFSSSLTLLAALAAQDLSWA